MTTLEKVKQWFIDRDLENGGRLDKQSLKLSEEFGELCAGYLKKNEQLTKDSIGDCAVVIVGLALLIKEDVQKIFKESWFVENEDVMECYKWLNFNICSFQLHYSVVSRVATRNNLVSSINQSAMLSAMILKNVLNKPTKKSKTVKVVGLTELS